MTSIKEKQVDKLLDKIIGDGDETLKIITKLAMMNSEPTIEMITTLEMMKKQNEEDAKAIEQELNYTMDLSGNMILLNSSTMQSGLMDSFEISVDVKSEYDVKSEPLEVSIDYSQPLEQLVFRLPVGNT